MGATGKLQLRLFGRFAVAAGDDKPVAVTGKKNQALLAYLAVNAGKAQPREKLAGLLWGDRFDDQARQSLRQAISKLRKDLGGAEEELLLIDGDDITLNGDALVVDVLKFEKLAADGSLDALEEAATLYDGAFLDGFSVRENAFEDWVGSERTRFFDLAADVLSRLCAEQETAGQTTGAIATARKLAHLDPTREQAHRDLMRLFVIDGSRSQALKQYQICADILRKELGIEPEPATQKVLEQIKRADAEPKQIARFAPDERLQLIETTANDDRPVIAVLPFANLSDDADFAYFADGLAEDLIFSLSSFRWFRVLARTATFRMREADLNPYDIRRMYGATYIVNGSVRRTGSKLRITVELVDCRNSQQLWAGQYDKALDDLFEVEDEITRQLASAIEPMLEGSEMRRTLGRPTETLAAYELMQRGYWHLYRGSQEDSGEARRCFEAAVERDSTYAGALAGLAFSKYRDAHANLMNNYRQRMEDSRNTAARALELDPHDPRALRYFAGASCFLGDQDMALDAVTRSIELCPSYASAYSGLAFVHDFKGNFSDAMPAADETIRLRPHDPGLHRCIMSKAIAHYQTGEYEHAERVARDSLRTSSTYWIGNMMLMASLGQRGRLEDASVAAQRICSVQPGITLEIMLKKMPFADRVHRDHLADGLIRAGWRDGGTE
jgi:DNA-binding SARP family transcriptional activator